MPARPLSSAPAFLAAALFLAPAGPAGAEAPPLVDAAWLKDRTCSEGVRVLDVRRSRAEHELGHVPCAVHTNFYEDGWRETRNGVPMLLPAPERLAALIGRLGIGNGDHVVVVAPGSGRYDAAEAAAVYVSLRAAGHRRVSILDGGLDAWTGDWENDVDTGYTVPVPRRFEAGPAPGIVARRADMEAARAAGRALVDLRPSDQFVGVNRNETVTRHGTIPGAVNLPLAWLTVNGSLRFHDQATLERAFAFAGVGGDPVLFCNAGLESALGWFVARELLGREGALLYDASLAEWSRDPALPMTAAVPPAE